MATTFKARVRNGKLEPLELPDDTIVAFTPLSDPAPAGDLEMPEDVARILNMAAVPEAEGGPSLMEPLTEIARLPAERPAQDDPHAGVNHDHYLYGAPRVV